MGIEPLQPAVDGGDASGPAVIAARFWAKAIIRRCLARPLRTASVWGLVWGAILLTGPSEGSTWVVWLPLRI